MCNLMWLAWCPVPGLRARSLRNCSVRDARHYRVCNGSALCEECSWSMPDDACLSHSQDTIVFCATSQTASAPQGAVRLLAGDGSPSINGAGRPEVFVDGSWLPICSAGASAGSAGVICKSMGFSGASGSSKCNAEDCGHIAPGIGELACSGSEVGPLSCPHEAGEDVFCAPSESLVVTCAGDGETQGRPAKESSPQPA